LEPLPLPKKYTQDEKFLNALADAFRLQESIISTTELAIISTTATGVINSFNRAAEQMLGYKAEEVIGLETPCIFHDLSEIISRSHELAEEMNTVIDPGFEVFALKARTSRMAERREWTYVRKDGSRFPVSLSITGLWDDHHNLTGYAGIATDISQQKKIDLKIKESEAHLQALISSLDDIVLEVHRNGTYLNVWTKNHDLLFNPINTYVGNTLIEVLGPSLGKKFHQLLEEVFTTRKSASIEYPSIKPDDHHWRLAKCSYIDDEHVLICVRDITQQKNAEVALKESEQKFRMLAENVPGAIYLCRNDETFSMIYLNDKIESITGYSAATFISGTINFVKLYHPADRDRIFAAVDQALTEKKSFNLEYRLLHKSGEWRWIEETGIGVYNNDSLVLLEGFISDITERKQAEEEFRQVADENSRIFNHSLTLNCVASFDGYFIKLNPIWEKMMGWSIQELLTKKFIEFVHPDDIQPTVNAFEGILNGSDLLAFENRYRDKNGNYHWLLWTSSPDIERKLIYASAIDISERKKSEEELLRSKNNLEVAASELQEQNKQLDEFAHIISHNLRSPVGNIKALVGLLNEKSPLEEYQLIFEKLKNVSVNLGETMNELMENLKVKKNTDVEMVELRFSEMLQKIVQSLEGELIQYGGEVSFDFNAAPKITYSKSYLESIFQNLLSNAIKYRSPKRKLQIHVSSIIQNGAVELHVRDNGQGIDLERYGDKLFGLHKTFHEHQDSRGVGLFLTRTQIEAMGGSIHAESKVDQGSTFIIRF